MDIKRIVIIAVSVAAAAAGAGYLSCGCSAPTQATIVRQGPPAAACLPAFLPEVIDAAQKHDAARALVLTAQLVECWIQHEPAPAPAPAPDAGLTS